MKRSCRINLSRMRKSVSLAPLSLGLAGIFLSGCADNRDDAQLFTSIDDCTNGYPGLRDVCTTTYQQALKDAEETGPKYDTEYDCEYDFGPNQCREENTIFGSFYMPLMAGYLVGNMVSRRPFYQPMYTSYSRYSPLRNRWFTPDGLDLGDIRKRNFKVKRSIFDKRPFNTSTLKRGGFGQMAKSSSSYRPSSRGWGG
uniref:DUF1190 domain-containing protein n=1 Tax=Ningiella ruwaisensis TaxID=2364274 RepID=UPI00109F1B49|nr:DUF1190 domain-containing protein [Ningiella ruwaisensis]